MDPPFKISNSRLNLFKDCKRCFWLSFNSEWRRPSTIFPSLPGGFDEVALRPYYDSFRGTNTLPLELSRPCYDGVKKQTLTNINLFPDQTKMEDYRSKSYKRGLIHQDKSLQSILNGALDELLITDEDKLVVLDYKTKSWEKNWDDLYQQHLDLYQDQLNIYTYLLQKVQKRKTESYGLLITYHPEKVKLKNGDFEFGTKLTKIPVNVNDAYNLWKDAITLINSSCPADVGDCEWCKRRP